MADPNLTQTLQNLGTNFPGFAPAVGGGGGGTPQSTTGDITALLKGPLLTGDKVARISDITSAMDDPNSGAAATVKTSGILDENDFISITMIAPFVFESGRVWIKQGVVYVGLCISLPAQTTAPLNTVGCDCAYGLPLNPGDPGNQGGGTLIAMPRYGRALYSGAPYRGSSASVEAPGPGQTGGVLRIGAEAVITGSTTAGYTEFITISGQYPINRVDAVV